MSTTPCDVRWWASIWHTGKFYCCWAFGETAAAAATYARRDATRWSPESLRELPGERGMVTLQRDNPKPVVYADFPLSEVAP